MSEIFYPEGSISAIYEEYANSYIKYCEMGKIPKEVRKYYKKIVEGLENLDKILAERGES